MNIIPVSLLKSTFHIQVRQINSRGKERLVSGTCFTINVDNRQYIITAQHLFIHKDEHGCWKFSGDSIDIKFNKRWNSIPITIIGHCTQEIDISVLTAQIRIPLLGGYEFPTQPNDIWYGDEMYFLGFPHGREADIGSNITFPILKSAKVSAGSLDYLLLDGHNNSGFSGGPVVYKRPRLVEQKDGTIGMRTSNPLLFAGVVSGYFEEEVEGDFVQTNIGVKSKVNSGMMLVYRIEHALALIRQNPIGMEGVGKLVEDEEPVQFKNFGE